MRFSHKLRHCERGEAIQTSPRSGSGLFRYARNDDVDAAALVMT